MPRRMKKLKPIKSITPEQMAWLQGYQDDTGFEPMHLDEIADGRMTFNQAAKSNIDWFESWMNDAYLGITRDVPFTEFGTHAHRVKPDGNGACYICGELVSQAQWGLCFISMRPLPGLVGQQKG